MDDKYILGLLLLSGFGMKMDVEMKLNFSIELMKIYCC
jgi:hypothetical protein